MEYPRSPQVRKRASRVRMLIKKFSDPNFKTPPPSRTTLLLETEKDEKDLSIEAPRALEHAKGDDDITQITNDDELHDYNYDMDNLATNVDTKLLINKATRPQFVQHDHDDLTDGQPEMLPPYYDSNTRYDTNHLISLATRHPILYNNDEFEDQPNRTTENTKSHTVNYNNTPDDDGDDGNLLISDNVQKFNQNIKVERKNDIPEAEPQRQPESTSIKTQNVTPEKEITEIFNKSNSPQIVYIDSQNLKVVSSNFVKHRLLPFKEKDFNCKVSFISPIEDFSPNYPEPTDKNTIMKKVYIANKNDFEFYKELSELVKNLLDAFHYSKFKEFPYVFYNYCCVLMDSGFNPVQDLIVAYLITFLKKLKRHKDKFKKLPLKIKLIARIFALKNLKSENFYDNKDVYDSDDSSDQDEVYEEDIVNKGEIANSSSISAYQLNNNWLLNDDFSLVEFNDANFNLLISRAIRYSIFLYWTRKRLSKKYFLNIWNMNFQLIKREKFLCQTWENFLLKKFFVNKFYLNYLKTKKSNRIAAIFNKKHLKSHYFNVWKDKFAHQQTISVNCKAILQRRFLKVMIAKYQAYQKSQELAINIFHQTVYRRFFAKQWRISFKLHQSIQRSETDRTSARNKIAMRLAFRTWKQKYFEVETMTKDAHLLSEAVFCGPILISWHQKVTQKQLEFETICSSLNLKILRRYLLQWKKLAQIRLLYYEFKDSQKRIARNFVFREIFLKKYNLINIQNHFRLEKNQKLLKDTFQAWKELTILNLKATKFDQQRLKVFFIHEINKSYEVSMIDKYYNFKLLQNLFKKWAVSFDDQQKLYQFNLIILRKFFMIWKESYFQLNSQHVKAINIQKYFLKFRFMKNWFQALKSVEEQAAEADVVFLKNKVSHNFVKGLQAKLETMSNNKLILAAKRDNHLKKRYFEMWLDKKLKITQAKLEANYEFFTSRKSSQLKGNFLQMWRKKQRTMVQLNKACRKFMLWKFFLRWIKRFIEVDDMIMQSVDVCDKNLMKKCFHALINTSNKNYEMRFRLESFLNNTNFEITNKVFRDWSFKLMKIKQKEQACEPFIVRWDKAKARNLLLIWYQKSLELRQAKEVSTSQIFSSKSYRQQSSVRKVSPIKAINDRINKSSSYSFMNDDYDDVAGDEDIEESPLMNKQKRIISTLKLPSSSSLSRQQQQQQQQDSQPPIFAKSPGVLKSPNFALNPLSASTPFANDYKIRSPQLRRFQAVNTTGTGPSMSRVASTAGVGGNASATMIRPLNDSIAGSTTRYETDVTSAANARYKPTISSSAAAAAAAPENPLNMHGNTTTGRFEFRTPSKSRIIDVSNMAMPRSEAIKSQRLESLKRYYNTGVRKN